MTNYIRKDTDKNGTIRYYNSNNQFHRLDGPAIEYANGSKWWHLNGSIFTEGAFNKHPDVIAYRNKCKVKEALGV